MCHLVLVFNLFCCSSVTVEGWTRHQPMDTALCTVCSCLVVSPRSPNKFRETSLEMCVGNKQDAAAVWAFHDWIQPCWIRLWIRYDCSRMDESALERYFDDSIANVSRGVTVVDVKLMVWSEDSLALCQPWAWVTRRHTCLTSPLCSLGVTAWLSCILSDKTLWTHIQINNVLLKVSEFKGRNRRRWRESLCYLVQIAQTFVCIDLNRID